MTRILLIFTLIFFYISTLAQPLNTSTSVQLPNTELKELDKVLKDAKKYDSSKKIRIDSLKRLLININNNNPFYKWKTNMTIGDEFKEFSSDSAMYYYEIAVNIATNSNDTNMLLESRIARLNAMSASGIFTEAEKELNSLCRQQMNDTIAINLWKAGRQLYSYMKSYVEGHNHLYNSYNDMFMIYDDKLLETMPKTDSFYQFIYAERLIQDGKYKEAKQVLSHLLESQPDNSNLYGMAAYQMAEVFRNQGDETQYARYLALSAMSDIKGSVKETLSLPSLAKWLYKQGDIDRAYRYINSSLEDAMVGNARMRTVAIAQFVPMIDDAYRQKINSSRDELMVYFLLVTFLLVLSGVLLFFVMKQMKRLKTAQKKLAATSRIQESYIGNFLGLCSIYVDKLESMSKLVSRKISAGQTDELLKLVKSGKFAEEESEDFYKVFDNAFLDLYPDFIFEINKLLREDEQISLKKDQGLPTELRIYAFVRLGIEESTKISQILHYSVSTIYTYRNRMRNKAINRDSFEEDVMKIGRNY